MKNWTIAKRIIAAGAVLIGLLFIVGAFAITALRSIEDLAVSRLRDDAMPGIIAISDISVYSLRAHISALMAGQSTEVAKRDAFIAQSAETRERIGGAMKTYEDSISSPEDRTNFETLKKCRADYVTSRDGYLALVKEGRTAEAATFASEKLESAFMGYRNQTALMLKWNQDVAVKVTGEIIQTSTRATASAVITVTTSLLIAVAAGWFIIRGVNLALRQMTVLLDDASGQVASAAGQVSGSSQSLAEGSSEQAASLEETSSSLEELSSMTKRNADSAQSAKALSAETRHAAEAGNTDMTEMRSAMDAIKTSSSDIAKIIKTIDEIAFQTNILALNAAVEAARAGEAGAGFAVVAEEVRALAQRSANSAKETAAKIEVAIQNGEHGVVISGKVASSLGVIVEKARKVDELVAEIANASSEQSQGIGQINTAVSQMDKITQSNAASAEETAAASEELSAQAAVLKDAVVSLRQLVGGGTQAASAPARAHAPTHAPAAKPAAAKRAVQLQRPSAPTRSSPPAAVAAGHDFFKDA